MSFLLLLLLLLFLLSSHRSLLLHWLALQSPDGYMKIVEIHHWRRSREWVNRLMCKYSLRTDWRDGDIDDGGFLAAAFAILNKNRRQCGFNKRYVNDKMERGMRRRSTIFPKPWLVVGFFCVSFSMETWYSYAFDLFCMNNATGCNIESHCSSGRIWLNECGTGKAAPNHEECSREMNCCWSLSLYVGANEMDLWNTNWTRAH